MQNTSISIEKSKLQIIKLLTNFKHALKTNNKQILTSFIEINSSKQLKTIHIKALH